MFLHGPKAGEALVRVPCSVTEHPKETYSYVVCRPEDCAGVWRAVHSAVDIASTREFVTIDPHVSNVELVLRVSRGRWQFIPKPIYEIVSPPQTERCIAIARELLSEHGCQVPKLNMDLHSMPVPSADLQLTLSKQP